MNQTLEDADAVARAAAEEVARSARDSIGERGVFRIAFPGGATPRRMLSLLARGWERARVDWSCAEILLTDERAVPPEDPDSNFGALSSLLLVPGRIPASRTRRMRGEAVDQEAEARACDAWYEPAIDLLVLGVGPDGHIASLFPGHAAMRERTRRVVAVLDSPKPPSKRLTISPRVIAEARRILVLATGEDKAAAVAAALEGTADPIDLPARLAGAGTWLLDRSAASGLTGLAAD